MRVSRQRAFIPSPVLFDLSVLVIRIYTDLQINEQSGGDLSVFVRLLCVNNWESIYEVL